MLKLLAIDLDGTLLNSYGDISNENKEAIKYALNKGVEVVLASGRDPLTMQKISRELGIENYLIAGNGASVYDIKAQKNIYENFIDTNKALKIIKMCKENSIFFVGRWRMRRMFSVQFDRRIEKRVLAGWF